MDVLVISDTHGRADRLGEVLLRTRADTVMFLGDGLRDLSPAADACTVLAVRGNCDWFSPDSAPESRLEIFGGVRIFLTHGHRYGVKGGIDTALRAAADADADVLLYGHTHVPFEKSYPEGTPLLGGAVLKKKMLVLCPGSLGHPQDGTPTFAMLTIRPEGILAGFGKL